MDQISEHLRRAWSGSRGFRIVLILAAVYAVLRLAVHGAYLAMMLYPNAGLMGGMPEWTGAESEPMVPVDLQVYLDAAEHLLERESLYVQGPVSQLEGLYQYAPAFSLLFVPFARMSPASVSIFHTLLHIAAYLGLYMLWASIFQEHNLTQASRTLALAAPLWLVFSPFWSDLGYLNIYVIMALLSTLLIRSILKERLGRSVLWMTIILQAKPQWAFAVAVPLLLGRHRFFMRLIWGTILAYGTVVGCTMFVAGPAYVGGEYADYIRFLFTLPERFPWRGPEMAYLGYNHSVKQVIIYLLGKTPTTLRLVTGMKLLLLAPLGIVSGRYLMKTLQGARLNPSPRAIELAFALYLGAFIWLDMVWELSLGIALFCFLLATIDQRRVKAVVCAVFIPYALIDLWQLLSFGLFGMDIMAPGPYILTDPSIYVPVVMIVILSFYAILVRRLWNAPATRWEARVC